MQNHSGPVLGGVSADTTELSLAELELVGGGAIPNQDCGPILGSRAEIPEDEGLVLRRHGPAGIPTQGI